MDSRVLEINTLIRSMSGMKSAIREVSKFVPKALVKDILESESVVAVGGKTRRVSIMFTDVAGRPLNVFELLGMFDGP